MGKWKPVFTSFRMKKWSGGIFITVLALVLVIRYGDLQTRSGNQSIHRVSMNQTVKRSKDLDFLFSGRNVSKEDSKALLVWSSMRPVLARVDGLPDTALGIKEAALAWKHMVYIINEKKREFDAEIRKCPASVNAFKGDLSGLRPVLEIPCGLIEDSSITVIGVPDKHSRSFQIQLLGSQRSGETNGTIVLHYNVTLSDDNVSEESSIVQNTWTKQTNWDKEVQCPGHGSSINQKVDELPLCNDQTVISTLEEPFSDGSVNFPFLKENSFTATLWVGLEGFHMTVNGRFETSFPYRKNLEPWSVSGVKVSGDLNMLSALATGLPVAEDYDLIIDEKFKAPSLPRERPMLLIGVFSTGNNFKRRMALRKSWMQYEALRYGKVVVRFLIGLHTNTRVNLEMWREAQVYGDIQFMPFVDYYGLISLKTISLCILGTKFIPANYIMKTDDDAFVRIDELLTSLAEKPYKALLYGRLAYDSSPDREEGSKWFINKEEWPLNSYPLWAHGPGYVISRDIAKFVQKGHRRGSLRLFKLEDVAMGIWIQQYNQSVQMVNYMDEKRFYNSGCESNYILAHYQSPRLLLCLWERLQKDSNQRPTCCH